jgi:CitB family two-component system response regulator MalR
LIKVMIVEDDPMVAEFNKCYLELVEGFTLEALVHTADEAFAVLDQIEIDLIMLDIFMPGMNGLDFLVNLRKQGKGVDVLVITAACDNNHIKKALRFGAVDYIIKPFQFERLNSALLAYKGLVDLMEQDVLNQVELDQCVLYKEQPVSAKLPKGVDRNTLNVIWKKIQELGQSPFSTEEIANQIGVSRVSMRKYLEFLKQIGSLKLELIYGTVGRPIYKYRCIHSMNNFVQRYL